MPINRAAFLSLTVLLACGQSEPPAPPEPPTPTGAKPRVAEPPLPEASPEAAPDDVVASSKTVESLDYEIPADAYELDFEDEDPSDIAGPDVEM